jgi:hypothetical protein
LQSISIFKETDSQQQLVLNVISKYAKQFEDFIMGEFVRGTA